MADEVTRKMSEANDRVPTWADEDRYWREHSVTRPYYAADRGYEYYQPAYHYGWESATRYSGRAWDDVETDLERGWDTARGKSQSKWQEIKAAVRDAWDRMTGHSDRVAKDRMANEMNPNVRGTKDIR
ncbi:MAG TPA: hypothetical protein VJ672_06070 [Gemmatimonadaceae bacterium]|nr:hypothetical protein [Gemmatimonadaceae bacterium]